MVSVGKGYVIKLEWVLIPILLIVLIGGFNAYLTNRFVQVNTTTQEIGSKPSAGQVVYQQPTEKQTQQPTQPSYQQLTPQQICENSGRIWCNSQCYQKCSQNQRFNCLSNSQPSCIPTYSIDDMKKSIVYIRHDVTGCCDSNGQYSALLGNSGSGVIYYKDNQTNTIYVLTSRHVVDCLFAGTCSYPQNETITIKTLSGNFYNPSQVWIAPQNLDLAVLSFQTTETIVPAIQYLENYSIGDKVTAIGYPVFGVQSTEPVLQFSVTQGSINNVYNLVTYQGLSFTAIQSDALTGHGSSGGGLFNQDGHLIGIITWGDTTQKITIAIGTIILSDIQQKFLGCPSNGYRTSINTCCQYGTILGTDGKCYLPCGKPTSICQSPNICYNNQCYSQCPSGYVFGSDAMCHSQCGSSYCSSGSYCYNNQCVSCPAGYYLATDGKCYPK